MPNKLFIRALSLTKDTESVLVDFEWALYERTGQKLASGTAASFDDVQQILDQNTVDDVQIIGIVPANLVYTTDVHIPGKQTRFVQQAVPFAVEDQLAEDLDTAHIALGAMQGNGRYIVEVISHDLFGAFYNALVDTGYAVSGVYSDASLLPMGDSDIVLGMEDGWALIKSKSGPIARVSEHNLPSYFDAISRVDDDAEDDYEHLTANSATVKCYVPADQFEASKILLAELELTGDYDWSNSELHITTLELLCESWYQQGATGTNLCQGEYKQASSGGTSFKQWRGVAAVAALWFLIQVGLDIGQGYYYEKEAYQYRQQALQIYKNVFPGERRVNANNVQRFLKGKLAQGSANQGGNDFLTLLSETGFQHSKIQNNQSVRFNSISFSDQRKELSIDLKAASFEQLDQLKNGLTSAGLGAKISSAVNEKDSVRGRLSVTGS